MDKEKWYGDIQSEAEQKMAAMYKNVGFVFQQTGRNRIVGWFSGYRENSSVPVNLILLITKRPNGDHSYMLYEGEIVASN